VQLTKHHGLGNDFLVTFVDEVPERAAALAVALCDRRTGIGADGLIFGIDTGSQPVMRLFNSDGSAAEISGNGMRCFVQALAMRRSVTALDVEVDTLAGLRACSYEATPEPAVGYASVDMGPVTAGDAARDVAFLDDGAGVGASRWAIGAVGNPHVVLAVENPDAVDLAASGPVIESEFPHGVNAHMVAVTGSDELTLRVWERGAGITMACGSGATVSAQRFFEWGEVGDRVVVRMPGGEATVDVATKERPTAVLSGATTFVGSVEVPTRG